MGTRSVTRFIEKLKDEKDNNKEKEVVMCAIYQQFDGYPSGVGMEIAEFLKDIEMVNGISDYSKPIANGIGCLSAQFISKFKNGVGGFYMTHADDSQEYNYDIIVGYEGEGWGSKPTQPIIRVGLYDEDGKEFTFEGTPEEFIELVKSEKVG